MSRSFLIESAVWTLVLAGLVGGAIAQQAPAPAQAKKAKAAPLKRAPLFFREEWKAPPTPGERPVSQEAVSNPALELKLYGAGANGILLSGNAGSETGPLNLWTGTATSPIAVTFRDRENYVDLTGLGKVRWITRTSGFHTVRPVVKLADGSWFVADSESGTPVDFNESDVSFTGLRWLALDIEHVFTRGVWVDKVDLSKVDEVGFADLIPGSGHGSGGWVNVAKVEVYGNPVKR